MTAISTIRTAAEYADQPLQGKRDFLQKSAVAVD